MPINQISDFKAQGSKIFVGRQPELSGPQFIALIGHDLNRYLLPRLQEAEARALGIDLKVDLLDPLSMARARPHLTEMLSMLPMLGFAGACIASPYKRAAVEHVDGLSLAAQAVLADNGLTLPTTGQDATVDGLRAIDPALLSVL